MPTSPASRRMASTPKSTRTTEGMVPMRDLDDDYYDFDEKNFLLRGRRHHHKYQLGDPIRIKVARANVEKRQLDFMLADTTQGKDKAKHTGNKK